jgi:hypothetical protein
MAMHRSVAGQVRNHGAEDAVNGKSIDAFYERRYKVHSEAMRAEYEIGWRDAKRTAKPVVKTTPENVKISVDLEYRGDDLFVVRVNGEWLESYHSQKEAQLVRDRLVGALNKRKGITVECFTF